MCFSILRMALTAGLREFMSICWMERLEKLVVGGALERFEG